MKRLHRIRRVVWLSSLGLLLTLGAGCAQMASAMLLFGEERTKLVKAEYPYLEAKRVLVLIWAEQDVLFDYPHVHYELGDYLRHALESGVRGLRCVPAKTVSQMQQENPEWDQVHPATHGERFNVDRVIFVELTRYGTREPDSPQLFRGHIDANVRVYDPSYGDEAGATYETTINTVYPEGGPGAWSTDDQKIRRETMDAFAAEFAGKFHDHRVKVD